MMQKGKRGESGRWLTILTKQSWKWSKDAPMHDPKESPTDLVMVERPSGSGHDAV